MYPSRFNFFQEDGEDKDDDKELDETLDEIETETKEEHRGGTAGEAKGRLELAVVCWEGKREPALHLEIEAVGMSEWCEGLDTS